MSELTFETAQKELEQIIKLWERGEELLRFCLARLEAAEGTIEELAQRAADAAPLPADGEAG